LKHIFKENYKEYIEKSISVIPDRQGTKGPAITDWKKYSERLPSQEELNQWCDFLKPKGSNIAVMLGKLSGIVCLDLDSKDEQVLALIEHLLPKSPIQKFGSKGYSRFFRWNGDINQKLFWNGEVVLEILSDELKTTIPPSIHENGSLYRYDTEHTLLNYDLSKLPVLPPNLIPVLELTLKNAFGDGQVTSYGKVVSGRNSEMTQFLSTLVNDDHAVDEVIQKMLQHDQYKNVPPLFTDPNENPHTEPYTNALRFYSNHLNSFNVKRFRDNKEYIKPLQVTNTNTQTEVPMNPKPKAQQEKKLKLEFLTAPTALKTCVLTILSNSTIKQPELAFGAALALFSTIMSRKFVYQGISPNLYLLNVSPSGTGKDYPMQFVKTTLVEVGAEQLLGAGDYVSDASLMDSLPTNPVRLDVMDEMGGILRTINSSKSDYASKMADILAELYTSSNYYYMGRAMASGLDGTPKIKGATYRPNVNILGSTTPTGFREGVTRTAVDKGLMGRFLIFMGEGHKLAERVKTQTKLPPDTLNHLRWLASYQPTTSGLIIKGVEQRVTELSADPTADARLDEIFKEFDHKRIEFIGKPAGPIMARLYQQMIKLVIIHAGARTMREVPIIQIEDVEFAYNTILSYYNDISSILEQLLFDSVEERNRFDLLTILKEHGNLSKQQLVRLTPKLSKHKRDSIIDELLESGHIFVDSKVVDGKYETNYYVKDL